MTRPLALLLILIPSAAHAPPTWATWKVLVEYADGERGENSVNFDTRDDCLIQRDMIARLTQNGVVICRQIGG